MSTLRRRVVVRGHVQGVGFRAAVADRAHALGVAGSVENRDDGALEAVFEGPPDAVGHLVALCRRGPRGAGVDAVDVAEEAPLGETAFSVRG